MKNTLGKVKKKREWEFNGKTKKCFMVRCLEKPFGIATPQRYKKGNPTVYHTVYKTDKIYYQTQVDENEKKKRVFFLVYRQEVVWTNELCGY